MTRAASFSRSLACFCLLFGGGRAVRVHMVCASTWHGDVSAVPRASFEQGSSQPRSYTNNTMQRRLQAVSRAMRITFHASFGACWYSSTQGFRLVSALAGEDSLKSPGRVRRVLRQAKRQLVTAAIAADLEQHLRILHVTYSFARPLIVCAIRAAFQIFAPFDPDQPPAYCTVYTHLVKSGGTSLKDQLQRQSVKGGMPKPGRRKNTRWPRSRASLRAKSFIFYGALFVCVFHSSPLSYPVCAQKLNVVSIPISAGLCTSDGRTTADMCLTALHNSTIIMGYGEELRCETIRTKSQVDLLPR